MPDCARKVSHTGEGRDANRNLQIREKKKRRRRRDMIRGLQRRVTRCIVLTFASQEKRHAIGMH